MFTGLIEDLGTVRHWHRQGNSARLTVATRLPMNELTLGESIAVNGICLTVVEFGGGLFSADVSPESLERSNLRELPAGSEVNLERALRFGSRLGGHLVTGHVDGIGTIRERRREGNAERFLIDFPSRLSRYVVEKGSIAVDGISLTVNGVGGDAFSLAIIPHTLEMTTLRQARPGARVNLETDILGKYVERLLTPEREAGGSAIDLQFLAKHGFV